jgi:hypothetical protein
MSRRPRLRSGSSVLAFAKKFFAAMPEVPLIVISMDPKNQFVWSVNDMAVFRNITLATIEDPTRKIAIAYQSAGADLAAAFLRLATRFELPVALALHVKAAR